MIISKAFAATTAAAPEGVSKILDSAPSGTGSAFMMNLALILVLVLMFYILLIMPQQRRFREHRAMVDSMKKGDKVLTAGGLIGVVDAVNTEKGEVVVDLGNGVKVTALRATIQTRIEDKK
ncbi:MAG: yajC [Micavibrio sp.]|nr:yajC [Micavibrio sp.]